MAESPDHADGEKVEPINNNTSDSSATPETAGTPVPLRAMTCAREVCTRTCRWFCRLSSARAKMRLLKRRPRSPRKKRLPRPRHRHIRRALCSLQRRSRFIAAFSSFVGSVSGAGFAHFYYPTAPAAENVQVSTDTTLQQLKGEFAALKAEVDSTMRGTNGQYSKIADRLDRLDQHFASATDTTGSIASSTAAELAQPKINDRILQDWAVRDVQNGRALVESRFGGIFDVGAGSVLPGVGRVDSIKRQDGQWLVLTARGTITSSH